MTLTTFKEEAVGESNIKIDWIISTWKDAELTDELVGIKSLILSHITTAHALGRKEALGEVNKVIQERIEVVKEGDLFHKRNVLTLFSTLQSFINELINKEI